MDILCLKAQELIDEYKPDIKAKVIDVTFEHPLIAIIKFDDQSEIKVNGLFAVYLKRYK